MTVAASTAADQLKRLLTLIPRLADGEEHRIEDVATIVGTSADAVIDDLRSLVERFEPGGFVESVQIYHEGDRVSLVTPHFLRPMRLTMPELCALELGLAMLRSERSGADLAPIERALARLRSVITQVPGDEVRESAMTAAAPAGVSARHLAALRNAVRQKRKARILYRRGSADGAESRTVCPYSLVHASGQWYVVAHCERAKALRVFRLDRITEVAEETETFEVPGDFSVDRVLEQSRAVMAEPSGEVLRIRYSPRIARWIAEREALKLEKDGSVVVEHPLHDDRWAVRHVLQYGAEATVLGPERIRQAMRGVLETGPAASPDAAHR